MPSILRQLGLFVAVAASTTLFYSAPASAQATRTWVSGVGDDVNPCSRTAPCKTFAGAISKTAAGGEINCLDPGGFGAVSIIKSMTINCIYTEGGALAGGNGITVNLPSSTDVVMLKGLDIFGVSPPTHGVRFVNNGTLIIEDCTIRRFNAANSFGVSAQPSGAAKLYIRDTTIADNGNGATGGGINVQPTTATGSIKVFMDNVTVINNANNGLSLNSTGATAAAGIVVQIDDSTFGGSSNGISSLTPVGASSVTALITNSRVFNNSTNGILGNGTGTRLRVATTAITGNNVGVNPGGGSNINDLGGNLNVGNTNNNTFN
ncbi:MAG TPA: hypothetical protein VEB68_12075 [Croceibacterium sp.]|nr:hypothetical protein [Croceibacterium sp.]